MASNHKPKPCKRAAKMTHPKFIWDDIRSICFRPFPSLLLTSLVTMSIFDDTLGVLLIGVVALAAWVTSD